jgi:hypothetical protein
VWAISFANAFIIAPAFIRRRGRAGRLENLFFYLEIVKSRLDRFSKSRFDSFSFLDVWSRIDRGPVGLKRSDVFANG